MEQEEKTPIGEAERPRTARGGGQRVGLGLASLVTCLLLVASVLLTWTLTSRSEQDRRQSELASQQAYYEKLIDEMGSPAGDQLTLLDQLIKLTSLYADSLDGKAMLEAAFKAYVEATGDVYARYYTEAEYAELTAENNGDFCGVGVTVVQATHRYESADVRVYRVIEVYEDSPALAAGMRAGDMISAVRVDGVWNTISDVGFDKALLAMRGEEGSEVEIRVLREESGETSALELRMQRKKLVTHSVRSELLETDGTVGIVHITGFDMTTPSQFKQNVDALLARGAEHFIFDVRGNPGGDLRSITAVLSYFLDEGDKVIDAIDKDGNVVATYRVEVTSFSGSYAGCSVTAEEIGMYKALDFTVLCNENTASAAEVFVATLRDYREEKGFRAENIIGTTTFGKGIMQTTRRVPFTDGTVAYLKLTTHAYVTKCGVSYHGPGIDPDTTVELDEEAKKQPLSALAQSEDAQLLAAAARFK